MHKCSISSGSSLVAVSLRSPEKSTIAKQWAWKLTFHVAMGRKGRGQQVKTRARFLSVGVGWGESLLGKEEKVVAHCFCFILEVDR